jgi:serine/threonine protein kinase
MKAEINRRCTPGFSINSSVSKKERLKDMPAELEDFFKKIFVVDSKKRMTFSAILKHPLLKEYEHEFNDNALFYNKLEKQQ